MPNTLKEAALTLSRKLDEAKAVWNDASAQLSAKHGVLTPENEATLDRWFVQTATAAVDEYRAAVARD